MEKFSRAMKSLLLVLLLLLLASALLLGTLGKLPHRSYLIALLGAVLLCALWLLVGRRLHFGRLVSRLGAGPVCALLSAVCFILQLAGIFLLPLEPAGDYKTFWLTAVDLARGQPLQLAEYVALFPHILGYSAFLSLFLRLFGVSLWVPALLNAVLCTASGALLYRLCLYWRDEDAAVFAFLLWMLCPSKFLYNSMVLSEPFYTCLLLLFFLLLTALDSGLRSGALPFWRVPAAGLAGGLLLSAVNAARPIAAVPLIAFGIWLLLLRGDEEKDGALWRRWICFAAVLVLSYGLLGRGWIIWETGKLGEAPASVPGYSMYVGFNPESLGSYADEDMDRLLQLRYGQEDSSALRAQEQMLEEAKERIRSGQTDPARLFPAKLRSFLGNDEGGAFYMQEFYPSLYAALALASNLFYYALLILTMAGAYFALRDNRPGTVANVPLFVIGLSLAHMLAEVAGRYHYSLIPMFILLAAFSRQRDLQQMK